MIYLLSSKDVSESIDLLSILIAGPLYSWIAKRDRFSKNGVIAVFWLYRIPVLLRLKDIRL